MRGSPKPRTSANSLNAPKGPLRGVARPWEWYHPASAPFFDTTWSVSRQSTRAAVSDSACAEGMPLPLSNASTCVLDAWLIESAVPRAVSWHPHSLVACVGSASAESSARQLALAQQHNRGVIELRAHLEALRGVRYVAQRELDTTHDRLGRDRGSRRNGGWSRDA